VRDERVKIEQQVYKATQSRIMSAKIPPVWDDKNFYKCNPRIHPKETAIAKEWAEQFNQNSGGLIFVSEGVGTGKTHLAICIAWYVLVELKKRVLFKPARDLLMELRWTFAHSDTAELDKINQILDVDLLVIDDMGRDRWSEWVGNTYWTLLDRCMNYNIPVIVTTNKAIEDFNKGDCLEARIGVGAYSRLMSICRHQVIHLEGEDLR